MTIYAPWYARRPYIHFDLALNPQDAADYVNDQNRIVGHAFYPFLTYEIVTPRIKKTPDAVREFTKNPKHRKISYPAHKDGYIFSYYKSKLEAIYEKWIAANFLGDAVTAFRATGQNNVTLAKKAFDFIKENPGCQIVATDVESFFDTINHETLKKTWARFLGNDALPEDHYAVYKAITHYGVVQRYKVYNLFGISLSSKLTDASGPKRLCTPKQFREQVVSRGLVKRNPGLNKGISIPQGSSLSPLLSNMYMADLDLVMNSWIASLGGSYWRYCDDILIVVPRGQRAPILGRLDQELKSLALKRSKAKTQRMNSSQLASRRQLQYLGFIFNGKTALIRSSSIHRYHRKLKKGVQAAKIRQQRESDASGQLAPLRKQALYNMFSELPKRGKRINARMKGRKHRGNFTKYMQKAAKTMNSPNIEKQRRKVLKKFRSRL